MKISETDIFVSPINKIFESLVPIRDPLSRDNLPRSRQTFHCGTGFCPSTRKSFLPASPWSLWFRDERATRQTEI